MTSLIRDPLRSLRRPPGVSLLVIAIVAAATGVNIAVFNAVNRVLLEPLPVRQPGEVLLLGEREPRPLAEVPYLDLLDWRRLSTSFSDMAAMGSGNWNAVLAGRGEPSPVTYRAVSGGWFDLLGMPAALGRTLNAGDDRFDAPGVVVISHGLWERSFGADRSALGTPVTLGPNTFTIVGVMPRGFQYPAGADLWMPLVPEVHRAGLRHKVDFLSDRTVGFLIGIGRLRPGATVEQARLELDTIIAQLGAEHGRKTKGSAALVPILDDIFGPARPALWALVAGAALVLLIAWSNVIGLLVARGADRARDLSIRVVLGASRRALVAALAAESVMLAMLGTLAGLVVSAAALPALLKLAPEVPRLGEAASFDLTAAVFAFALAALTGLACGVIPARQIVRGDVAASLAAGSSRSGQGVERRRLRRALATVQIAIAFTLLVAVALFGRSVQSLDRLDLGFSTEGLLAASVVLPDWRYPTMDDKRRFHERLLLEIERLPGVVAAGGVFLRPLRGLIGLDARFWLPGQSDEDAAQNPWTNWESVTPGYFRTMRIPLVRGRLFTDDDRAGSRQVAVVSEGFARAVWPRADAIGQRIRTFGAERQPISWFTIVGVVGDVRYRELTGPRYDVYVPVRQANNQTSDLMVRAAGDPALLTGPIRELVRQMDAAQVVTFEITRAAVDAATKPWRFNLLLFGVLAGVGIGLAAAGLFGVLSRGVAERSREIGIRKALGATDRGIARLVAFDSAALVCVGLTLGVVAALVVVPALRSLLFAIQPLHAPAFASAAALVALVALAATSVPVYRAVRLDPALLLRTE
jgi:predicted permease